jgi:di/tripeptidase
LENRAISRITEILATDPDFFVPIKKLWLILQEDGLSLDIDEFQQMLQEDERFEFAPGVNHKAGFENNPEMAEKTALEMEAQGFYSGPRVKLVSREMTAKDIFEGMARSLERMNQALQNAWDARPQDDQDTEDQLLEILAAGQRLQREISALVDRQETPNSDL